jgi:hypothetical protein
VAKLTARVFSSTGGFAKQNGHSGGLAQRSQRVVTLTRSTASDFPLSGSKSRHLSGAG